MAGPVTSKAEVLSNLGMECFKKGEQTKALEYFEKALLEGDIDDTMLVTILMNSGVAQMVSGDANSAAKSLERALEVQAKSLGESSPELIGTLQNLTVIYSKLGETTKAVECMSWAGQIESKVAKDAESAAVAETGPTIEEVETQTSTPEGVKTNKKESKKQQNKKAKDDEKLAEDPAKKLKKVVKEGGKRGVEIEGAADMGGLQFFCTSVDEPQGDTDLLLECVNAMNEKSDPTEEERKGGSGRIGKMVFSAGTEHLAILAYVPEDKQAELVCEEWLKKLLALWGGKVVSSAKDICIGTIATDSDKNIFPLKIREGLILEANNFLRAKGLFPEDNGDDSDEMVFGDDDFPSM